MAETLAEKRARRAAAGETRASRHRCHATACNTIVPPAMFMCKRHWFMLPIEKRTMIWSVYVPGQEERMDPTDDYLRVAMEVIDWLAVEEGLIINADGSVMGHAN